MLSFLRLRLRTLVPLCGLRLLPPEALSGLVVRLFSLVLILLNRFLASTFALPLFLIYPLFDSCANRTGSGHPGNCHSDSNGYEEGHGIHL